MDGVELVRNRLQLFQQFQAPLGQRHALPLELQAQAGFAPACGGEVLVVRQFADFGGRVGWAVRQQTMQQKHIQKAQRARANADHLEGVQVHQPHFDVFHPALAQRVQGPLAGVNDAFGPDGAVKLVFDLQQRGGELVVVTAGVADAQCLVSGPGTGERVLQRGGVALQPVVAHGQRGLGVALVAQPPHAQAGAVRHVQRTAGAQRLQFVLAPFHKRRAHRWRGTKQREQQKRVAAEIADQRKVAVVVHTGQRPVVVNARNGLHAPSIAVAQPHAVDTLGASHVAGTVAAQRNGFVGGQAAGHAGGPQHFVTGRAQAACGELVHFAQLVQTGAHAVVHARDQFQLGLAVIGGDVGVRERTAQRGRVRREGQFAIGLGAQAFFFQATAHAAQALAREGVQPLL